MAVVLEGSGNDIADVNLRRVHALNSVTTELGSSAGAECKDPKRGRIETQPPVLAHKMASGQAHQLAMNFVSKNDAAAFRCASVGSAGAASREYFTQGRFLKSRAELNARL